MSHKLLAIAITFFGLFIFTVKAEAAIVKVDEPCDLKYSMDLINANKGHGSPQSNAVDLALGFVPNNGNGTSYPYQVCLNNVGRASINGTVTAAKLDDNDGLYVDITGANNTKVRALHFDEFYVSLGDQVLIGDPIGKIGTSGLAPKPHIHFEVFQNGTTVPQSNWAFADLNYSDAPIPVNRQVTGNFEGDLADTDDDTMIMKDMGGNQMRLWNYISTGSTFNPLVAITQNDWSVGNTKHIVSGRFNNDHLDDIAVMYKTGTNKIKMYMFFSNADGTVQSPIHWYSSVTDGINWDTAMSLHMEAGDFNGDGRDDIVASYANHDHKIQLWVWLNSGGGLYNPVKWYESGSTAWESRGIKFMNAGDFNADGKEDLIGMFDDGDDNMYLRMFGSTGSSFGVTTVYDSLVHGVLDVSRSLQMLSGDSNNDGRDEITIAYHTPANRLKLNTFTYNGSTMPFVEKYASEINDWKFDTTKYSAMGDFTGDGLEEPALTSKLQDSRLKLWVFKTDPTGNFVREVWHVTGGTWNI